MEKSLSARTHQTRLLYQIRRRALSYLPGKSSRCCLKASYLHAKPSKFGFNGGFAKTNKDHNH